MENRFVEFAKKCLRHAKLLYFCVLILVFVVVRGVFPFWYHQVGGGLEEVSVSPLSSTTTAGFLTTTSFSTDTRNTKIVYDTDLRSTANDKDASTAEARKAFGNSNGLGYTIKEFNQLTEQELLSFHGVGKVTAKAIVELRTIRGGFRTFDELLDVRGIGPAKLKKILGERDETN